MSTPVSYAIGELVTASGFDRRTIVYYIQQGILPRVGRRGPGTRYPAECLGRLQFVKGIKDLQNGGRVSGASLREIAVVLARTPADRITGLLAEGLPAADVEALFREPPPLAAAPDLARPVAPPPDRSPPAPSPVAAPVAATAPAPATPPAGAYVAPGGAKRSYGLADAGIRRRPLDSTPAPGAAPATPPATAPAPASGLPPAPGPVSAPPPEERWSAPAAGATAPPPGENADLGELLRHLELRAGMSRRRAGPGASEQWTEIPVTGRVYLSIRGLSDDDLPAAESVVRALKRAIRA